MSIVITGEGILSALGRGKGETLETLRTRRSGIGRMRHLRSVHTELPVGEVPLSDGEMKDLLCLPQEEPLSRTVLMADIAIREALEDAGLDAGTLRQRRVALVSGTTVGGMDLTERYFLGGQQGSLAFLGQHDCGGTTAAIARHFGFFTEQTTLSTACSSAANALMAGAEMLRHNEADVVVAGGSEALSLFHLNGFNALMILDREPCRPFSADRAGLNLGEGAAYVVMERDGDARQRDAAIHAHLAGWGNACDAFHQTASSENGEGAFLAMRQALDSAGVDATQVDYVNAHGTGTVNNDDSESKALRRVFGPSVPPVSSTKGFTGHTTSASGSIEAVICLLAMRHGFIPANEGWKAPMAEGIQPSMGEERAALRHVLCNSFGFGGNCTALLFADHATGHEPETGSGGEARELARAEIDSVEDLSELKRWVKPMEMRRMGKLMKASLLSSLKALERAGVAMPDAIITATAYGCVENSERLLKELCEEGEQTLSPTLFMQSTHNTISSNIAIRLGCHGYNVTYSQGGASLQWALRDARRLIAAGQCRTVLVGCHDESTPAFSDLMEHATGKRPADIHSLAIVLSC